MKYILIFLMLFPFNSRSQFNNLKLEKGQVYFEKEYTLDSIDITSVEKLLTMNVPKIKDVSDFNKSVDFITAKLKDAYIDYKKYGGKWGNTWAVLNHPFFGDVSIIWKDQKYRVTITNMYFNTAGFGIMKCSDMFAIKNATEFTNSKISIKSGEYVEKYLSDLFLINKSAKDNW